MRARDLPACRTLRFAHPADVVWTEAKDHVVCDAPQCRAASFSHRLILDAPPSAEELPAWAEVWRAAHGGKGVATAYAVWEGRDADPPPGVEAFRTRVLMLDRVVDAPPGDHRPLGPDDADALTELFCRVEGDWTDGYGAYARWYTGGLLARAGAGQGAVYGAWRGDALAGVGGCMWSDREARIQAVAVDEAHRRQGIATRLVLASLAQYQEVSFGVAYAVAEEGGPEALYRAMGFRRVTSFFETVLPV